METKSTVWKPTPYVIYILFMVHNTGICFSGTSFKLINISCHFAVLCSCSRCIFIQTTCDFLSSYVVCSLYNFYSFCSTDFESPSHTLVFFHFPFSMDRSFIVSMTSQYIEINSKPNWNPMISKTIENEKKITRLKYLCWHFTYTHVYMNTNGFKTTEHVNWLAFLIRIICKT